MTHMDHETLASHVVSMLLTTAHLAYKIQDLEETPSDESPSKYSFFMMVSPDVMEPKLVRHVVRGWGAAQQKSLLDGAQSTAVSGKGEIATSVVASYATPSTPVVKVSAFCRNKWVVVDFPVRFTNGRFEYAQPLQQSNDSLMRIATEFVTAARKRLLGIF